MPDKAEWTILVYIAAHNNLDWLGERSRQQILDVGSSEAVKLTVLYDGTQQAERFIVGKAGERLHAESFAEFNSGDADELIETMRWTVSRCPAHRYGLILWSHGTGWRPEEITVVAEKARGDKEVDSQESAERAAGPGSLVLFRSTLANILRKETPGERAVCFDDGTGHSLDTLELARVTDKIQTMIEQPLDLLGMDACLMASLEVAYQLRHAVNHYVASQELVPGFSWPYDSIFQALLADPTVSGADLSRQIVRHYVDHYANHPPKAGDVTKVAVNLSQIEAIVTAAAKLAEALIAAIDEQASFMWQSQWEAFMKETKEKQRKQNKFQFHLWDVATMAERLAQHSSDATIIGLAHQLVASLKPHASAVLAEGHLGNWFDRLGGLSVYMPPPQKQRISPDYASLAFAHDANWNELLTAYHAAAV